MSTTVTLSDVYTVLCEIRDALRHAPPLAAVPYEQLAALIQQHAVYGPGDDDYGRKRNTLMDAGITHAQAMQAMQAIPLPPPRPAGSLHVTGPYNELPDPVGTPGAVQEGVTAAMILAPGYTTKSVRPPTSYTDALKRQQMMEYNLTGDPSLYEEDHLVPLECAGHPTSPDNLWPQLRTGDFGARVKDLTENAARAALASGAMTLEEIQMGFRTNWHDLHDRLFSNPKVVGAMMMTMIPPSDEP
jgi:hypothetical protein